MQNIIWSTYNIQRGSECVYVLRIACICVYMVCVCVNVCGLISFLIAFSSGCTGQLAFQSVPLVSYEMSPHLKMIHPL